MQTEDYLAHERSRMEVYRLLADCFHLLNENLKNKLVRLGNTIKMLCGEAAGYVHLMEKDLESVRNYKNFEILNDTRPNLAHS